MLHTKSQKRKPHSHPCVSIRKLHRLLVCFFVVDCGTRGTKKVKKIMSNAPTIEESQKTVIKNFRSMTRSGSLQFQIHRYLLQLQLEIESHEKNLHLIESALSNSQKWK